MLKIYNTLTRKKQLFIPIEPDKVSLYVCGMTVYNHCHIGHARVLVVFDMVYRYLQTLEYKVNYVRNVTDIDDKIIKRAHDEKIDFSEISQRFIASMHESSDALGVIRPTFEPHATHYMPQMIKMIQTLIDKGYAYQGSKTGDVFYNVHKFPNYGQLSGKLTEDLRTGDRADHSDKQDPLDFVLWKMAKKNEPSWPSPWGDGRPGWHIECSAMSCDCLGAHFDIHGGGMDLQFPHHENEIAQSEAANEKTFVNYWMHNGFVRIDDEKMSQSLGNFFTVREVLAKYKGETIRFFILSSHYRSPLNYSEVHLEEAEAGLSRLYNSLRNADLDDNPTAIPNNEFQTRFNEAMNDDFNTPEAIAVLFDIAREINRLQNNNSSQSNPLAYQLKQLAETLGLLQMQPDTFLKLSLNENALNDEKIEALISERKIARSEKNYARSDEIREALTLAGIVLEDNPKGGTIWRRK